MNRDGFPGLRVKLQVGPGSFRRSEHRTLPLEGRCTDPMTRRPETLTRTWTVLVPSASASISWPLARLTACLGLVSPCLTSLCGTLACPSPDAHRASQRTASGHRSFHVKYLQDSHQRSFWHQERPIRSLTSVFASNSSMPKWLECGHCDEILATRGQFITRCHSESRR